jgi:hypothetical protein
LAREHKNGPSWGLPNRAEMLHPTSMTRYGKILWVGDAMPDLRPPWAGNPVLRLIPLGQAGRTSTSDEMPNLDEPSRLSDPD